MVVTIIVLLILAAVAINLTIGDNGIFSRAQNATEKWKEASENESKELGKAEDLIDEITSKVSDENPGEMSGEGTEESPYLIQSIEDLVAFSEQSTINDFYMQFISLDTDLNFNSDNSYVNPNTTEFGDINRNNVIEPLKTELTTGSGFKPIAYDSIDFRGFFNGNNYTISNIYINNRNWGSGLFEAVSDATIENVKVEGNIVSDSECGGIVANIKDNVIFRNCISNVNLITSSSRRIGGIVGNIAGMNSTIINCQNYGSINVVGDRFLARDRIHINAGRNCGKCK